MTNFYSLGYQIGKAMDKGDYKAPYPLPEDPDFAESKFKELEEKMDFPIGRPSK